MTKIVLARRKGAKCKQDKVTNFAWRVTDYKCDSQLWNC